MRTPARSFTVGLLALATFCTPNRPRASARPGYTESHGKVRTEVGSLDQ
jgi:hypothetical protein